MSKYLAKLECSVCSENYTPRTLRNLCPNCNGPLLARYDLDRLGQERDKRDSVRGEATIWRYFDLLPVDSREAVVSLGEGWTPLLPINRAGESIGLPNLWLKDEGRNPTGTFKDRGASVAISRARELGVSAFTLGSSGNAGSAWAAYAARAGVALHLAVLQKSPELVKAQSYLHGTYLYVVEGFIREACAMMSLAAQRCGWFDVSTLCEPYRVEGKKTMGLEIAEQMGWQVPDAILYPTGGGVGLIGIWKAMEELGKLGWIGPKRPKMVAVQSEACAPIVRAFQEDRDECEPWEDVRPTISILRAAKPLGDRLALRVLRESSGTAIAVSDEEMLWGMEVLGTQEGVLACPEGAATLAAARRLRSSGFLTPHHRVVLLNTGTALKRMELIKPELSALDPMAAIGSLQAERLVPRSIPDANGGS